jgi:hypothetical protein
VADGATEAFDARRWALRLAESWVASEIAPVSNPEFGGWVATQGTWLKALWDGHELPWYADEKRTAGSFAAFVGLRIDELTQGVEWRAVALGDSCLIQLRNEQIIAAMPLKTSEDFNSAPPLLPSNEVLREAALARAVYTVGQVLKGDTFLLLSDAIAAWFFQAYQDSKSVLRQFDSLIAASDNEAVSTLVCREREHGKLKDDDVAVVRVAIQ